MVALYLTSTAPAVGKTTIGAGLGKNLQNQGKKVGYFKPLPVATQHPDPDAVFMKRVLALTEAEDVISPVLGDLTHMESVPEAYRQMAAGKDVVIIEGMMEKGQADGMVAALDARMVLVASYATPLPVADLIAGSKELGKRLLGVVLNKVPRNRLERTNRELSTQLAPAGISLLGVLPEDRTLLAITVGELAEHLGGKILNHAEKSGELVENFMLGALGIDCGVTYLERKANKAVITRVGRADVQLAALETPTRCLVVTGGKAPSHVVLHRAEEKEVPLILAKEDVNAVVATIEEMLNKSRFHQEQKLPRLAQIMASHFNFKTLYQGLGLAG